MKRTTKLLAILALVLSPMVFISCDEDPEPWGDPDPWDWYDDYNGYHWNNNYNNEYNSQDQTLLQEAQTLCGEWEGTMKYTYTDESTSKRVTEEYYTNMKFFQYNASSNSLTGEGVEVDYLPNDPSQSQTLAFSWAINEKTGDIYIKYKSSGTTFVMDADSKDHGFLLGLENNNSTTDVFFGWMIGTSNVDDVIYIDLTRVETNAKAALGVSATTVSQKPFGIYARSVGNQPTTTIKRVHKR